MQTLTVKELKGYIKKGDTVYTILRHVSRSGMLRHISAVVIRKNEPYYIDHLVSKLLDYKHAKSGEGLKVGGCGMDMGYHVVYNLASKLFKDGYAVKHRWL